MKDTIEDIEKAALNAAIQNGYIDDSVRDIFVKGFIVALQQLPDDNRILPNLASSTENLSKIKNKDEWLNELRGTDDKMKETIDNVDEALEKAAVKYADKPHYTNGQLLSVSPRHYLKRGFKDGAQWQAENINNILNNKPKVVCFCGSTRFAHYFMIERWLLEKQGIITLGINILPDNYFIEGNAHGAEQEGVKEILDDLHKRKIDLSDEVVILNVGGYIGESTRAELEYAQSIGKPIKFYENG